MSTACLLARKVLWLSPMPYAHRAAHSHLHHAWRFQGCQTKSALWLLPSPLADEPMWALPQEPSCTACQCMPEVWEDDGWAEKLGKAVTEAVRDFGRVRFASRCGAEMLLCGEQDGWG